MASGIFGGRKLVFNIKCVIFTLMLAGGYWTLPPKNLYILFFLLWAPYVAMAWYDYSYECKDKIKPTVIPLGRYIFLPFKPPGYKQDFDKLSKDTIGWMDRVDHITLWSILVLILFKFYLKK